MSKQPVSLIFFEDLPKYIHQSCGASVYRNVLVCWDEDYDVRVLEFIDELPDDIRAILLMASEKKGNLMLFWSGNVPDGYDDTQGVELESGDYWSIHESVAIPAYVSRTDSEHPAFSR